MVHLDKTKNPKPLIIYRLTFMNRRVYVKKIYNATEPKI
jgi:hypothetical protein